MHDLNFYNGKKVLITGHTGFKGTWMSKLLLMKGANLVGYSVGVPTKTNLFDAIGIEKEMNSIEGDIRDLDNLIKIFENEKPEIVIHMAAQPIVRESYINPVYTYETNVMGTVNILECIRRTEGVSSFVNVTTDKVYLNKEWEWGYRENEELNGYDPYSNSKSCSELVTSSYKKSFFEDSETAISTARAGNVIGGGDFAKDRIVPDCVRAAEKNEAIKVRNPHSIRPYQHVLEPVTAYLMIAMEQYEDKKYSGSYNVGPDENGCVSTGKMVNMFCGNWNNITGDSLKWIDCYDGGPHESNFLKLDCSKLKKTFSWKPVWDIKTAVEKTAEWYACYVKNGDYKELLEEQIKEYLQA